MVAVVKRTAAGGADWASDVPRFSLRSSHVYQGDMRLDATAYAEGATLIVDEIEGCGLPIDAFGEMCKKMWHPVQNQARSNFTRIYTSPEHGVPFVGSREMFSLPIRPKKFLAKRMPKLSDLMVPEGWLLVSRSGTVGNVLLVSKMLANCAISDHAIRIGPKVIIPEAGRTERGPAASGYLYAFLSSRFGQPLIERGMYGALVSELEPKHLDPIPLPRLPADVEDSIHDKIFRAYELRDQADELFTHADRELHAVLGLSAFSEDDDVEYLSKRPRAFTVSSLQLGGRFDATNHVPLARSVVTKLKTGRYPLTNLAQTDTQVTRPPRFKRIYVNSAEGVPFFQPHYIPLFRPLRFECLSRRANADVLPKCMLEEGTIIVTRSGTAADSCLVTAAMTKWAGSDDLLRVRVGDDFDSGFLAAFFATPYARHQMLKQLYGGVVSHIDERDIESIACPVVPKTPDQTSIGDQMRLAYSKRDAANELEDEAIRELEAAIEQAGKSKQSRERRIKTAEQPPGPASKLFSLYPISPDDALRRAMQAPPVDNDTLIAKRVEAVEADVKAGRVLGPFDLAKDLIRAVTTKKSPTRARRNHR